MFQVKVREATNNDPGCASATLIMEIAGKSVSNYRKVKGKIKKISNVTRAPFYLSAVSRRIPGVGDPEHDLHTAGRPQSLQTRLQVSCVVGEADHSRQCSG